MKAAIVIEPSINSTFSDKDFESLEFHDCYVHGIRWGTVGFSISLEVDYIVRWVKVDESFRFWVVPAELSFRNVADPMIALDWTHLALDCQINEIRKLTSRKTPNGNVQYHWEIELSSPNGSIEMWATGFELRVLGSPEFRDVPNLRLDKR